MSSVKSTWVNVCEIVDVILTCNIWLWYPSYSSSSDALGCCSEMKMHHCTTSLPFVSHHIWNTAPEVSRNLQNIQSMNNRRFINTDPFSISQLLNNAFESWFMSTSYSNRVSIGLLGEILLSRPTCIPWSLRMDTTSVHIDRAIQQQQTQ